MNKPKTIADLGSHASDTPKAVAGRDMLNEGQQSVDQRIEDAKKRYAEEMAMLEEGGYDYGGNEDWISAMKSVGRR